MPEELLERIAEFVPPDKQIQLEDQIKDAVNEGIETMSLDLEPVDIQRTDFFLVALLNINITEDLGEGYEIVPTVNITNNKDVIRSFLSEPLHKCIGNLEFHTIANAKAIFYSELLTMGLTTENNDHITRLESFLQLCRKINLCSWFVKDNSINFELGFAQLIMPRFGFTVASNFLASIFTTARGKIIQTTFSRAELEILGNTMREYFTPLLILDQKPSRISSTIKYLSFARQTGDLGLKISFYCICFESLFSTDTTELSHKISERIAIFLGDTSEDRANIFQRIKSAYSIRSKIVHGDKLSSKDSSKISEVVLYCDDILRIILTKVLKNKDTYSIFLESNELLERYLLDITLGIRKP